MHTPHTGGVLHDHRIEGNRLVGRAVAQNVSTYRIGSRELSLAAWLGSRLVLPQQNGLALRVSNASSAWTEVASIALLYRVAMTVALPGGQGVAALLDDGR